MSDTKLKGKNFDGILSAAEILNQLSPEERKKMLENLAGKDPALTDKIRQRMFTFEDLVKIEDSGLQLLLRSIPSPMLVLALRTMETTFKDQLFKNLSARITTEIKEGILSQGPQK